MGTLIDSYSPTVFVPIPEGCESKSFIHITGEEAITSAEFRAGVGRSFDLHLAETFKKYYASGAWGEYGINRKNFSAAFSITIAEPLENHIYNNVGGSVFHWIDDYQITNFQISFSLPISITFTSTVEDVSRYIQSSEIYYTIVR